jgi:hypothetical protein
VTKLLHGEQRDVNLVASRPVDVVFPSGHSNRVGEDQVLDLQYVLRVPYDCPVYSWRTDSLRGSVGGQGLANGHRGGTLVAATEHVSVVIMRGKY